MARTKIGDKPAERCPSIARWCDHRGRIEVGHEWQDILFARALHEGSLAWCGEGPYATIDDALRAIDEGIREFMQENGRE